MTHVPLMRPPERLATLLLTAAVCSSGLGLLCASGAEATISRAQPLEIRIFMDNSGSMYPGYSPDSGLRRSDVGAKFFHEHPRFREWVADFVAKQTILNGRDIGMSVFTSSSAFGGARDISEIHRPVPLGKFDVAAALDKVAPLGYGSSTYLAESLEIYTEDFEGLVWLITDNIVETGAGEPAQEVLAFFRSLNTLERYRSIHLFKLPFQDPDTGLRSDLAIYAILVSKAPIPDAKYFDRKFRNDFRRATRPGGPPPRPLFPGREHLKLKDLQVDALELRIPKTLKVTIEDRDQNLFSEWQTVRLELPGTISSNLTQHRVIGGRYTLSVVGPFVPPSEMKEEYGIESIPAESFSSVTRNLERAIPPTGKIDIETVEISSKDPLTLSPSGLWAWIKAAVLGLRVEFLGSAQMSFEGVRVQLETKRMAGIYGVSEASKVFKFQDIQSLPVAPDREPVSFVLETGSRRGFLLLIIVLVLGTPLAVATWFLLQKAHYRVTVGTNPATVVGLRRLGSHRISYPPHSLGRLVRRLGGNHQFQPNRELPNIRPASATRPGSYSVPLPGGEGLTLVIEPLDSKHQEGAATASGGVRRPNPVAPPPSGAAPKAMAAPAARTERLKRPTSPSRRPTIRRPGK